MRAIIHFTDKTKGYVNIPATWMTVDDEGAGKMLFVYEGEETLKALFRLEDISSAHLSGGSE